MDEEKPQKHITPLNSRIVESDSEMRFELPFTNLDNMFYIGVNATVNWTTNFHFHDHFELCYLDQGPLSYSIDKSLYHVDQGELFITKPGERHYGLAGGNSNFRLYYMGFKLDQMRGMEAEYYNIGVNRIVKDAEGQIKRLFDLIIGEVRNRRQVSTEMVHGLFLQLLATVLRLYLDRTQLGSNKPKMLVSHIIKLMDYLHEEIRYDHSIEEIADKIHISRSHLAREFKAATGRTIGDYMRNLCLDKAKYELRETDKSISSIGEELRFSSIHTFSIFFKHCTGFSPLEYRKHSRL
ncbi:helix-turn-helix domain-containing protein [Paenibacillus solisilvae]|uniref:Helix-turn-helix domain-containing protein n=1 Tax=Paenibacillus solisilvae TaxID=2486751 RepID=A0ABW0VZ73_9BACL